MAGTVSTALGAVWMEAGGCRGRVGRPGQHTCPPGGPTPPGAQPWRSGSPAQHWPVASLVSSGCGGADTSLCWYSLGGSPADKCWWRSKHCYQTSSGLFFSPQLLRLTLPLLLLRKISDLASSFFQQRSRCSWRYLAFFPRNVRDSHPTLRR